MLSRISGLPYLVTLTGTSGIHYQFSLDRGQSPGDVFGKTKVYKLPPTVTYIRIHYLVVFCLSEKQITYGLKYILIRDILSALSPSSTYEVGQQPAHFSHMHIWEWLPFPEPPVMSP